MNEASRSVGEAASATALVPSEVAYILLLFGLFVVPRALQRYRVPTAITSLALGAVSGMGLGLFTRDPTVELLSTFGIVSLFLFAGLEAEIEDLRREARVLAQHLALRLLLLAGATYALAAVLGLETRAAALVALALLTPSGGFILSSLQTLGLSDRERFWIRSKVVATELVALGVLFVALQSASALTLAASAAALAAMIVLLPWAFRVFAQLVVPYAPKSEFAFLIMVAVVCAFVTRSLGVYYLVGAFVVGMAAQRFREHLPAMASEQMLHAVEAFASLFVPFYFFHAGLGLRAADFALDSLLAGAAFLVTAIPLRVAVVSLHRRLSLGEPLRTGLRISVSMVPTLVFTLVIAEILRERFELPRYVFGGLIVYTIVNTALPSLVLRTPPPAFDAPHLPSAEPQAGEPSTSAPARA